MEVKILAKFLAIHTLPTPATSEEAAVLGKKAKAKMTVDAYWVKSWAQLNNDGKQLESSVNGMQKMWMRYGE